MVRLSGEKQKLKMKMENKDLRKYLLQTKEIYGDQLYINKTDYQDKNMLTLDQYYHSIKDCLKCPLGNSRTNFVFGSGNYKADIVFVGEAPGLNEDLEGMPFVGRSGKLLDKILAAINLTRNDIYILNVIKCRPPDNRNPNTEEMLLVNKEYSLKWPNISKKKEAINFS